VDDETGDLPMELDNWGEFVNFFKVQWYDSGSIINARKKWRRGVTQTGSAKVYFAILEQLIVKLGYDKDSAEVKDLCFEALKHHIQTHFALEIWPDFRTMKENSVAYDEAYFAQNQKTDKEYKDYKDFKGKGKKNQKAETAVITSGSKRLLDEDWEMCKVKGFCFVCKKIGKDVLGLAKEHPNHPTKEKKMEEGQKTKKVDKKFQKKKNASVRATDMDLDGDKTEVSDSDSDDQPEGSKN